VAVGIFGISCDTNKQIDLIQPRIRQSLNGLLNLALNIGFASNVITGQDGPVNVFTRTYNRSIPGPTLRVKPGDTMNIELRNNLPPNTDTQPVNMFMPHLTNSTNLHTHGLHVSPSGSSDNVLLVINPGETFTNTINIPFSHPGGTHWYHPHKHGSVDIQMTSGMSGVIIIEGELDQVPEIAAAREVVLLFQEMNLSSEGEVEDPDLTSTSIGGVFPSDQTLYTVNGQLKPVLRARPGEVLRLRCVNGTIGTFYPLQLDDHDLNWIAHDGISFPEVRTIQETLLAPGNRDDFLIKAGAPGTYQLKGLEFARSSTLVRDEVELLTLVVEGSPMDMPLPTTLVEPPYAPITDDELTGTRELVFDTVDNEGQFPSGYTLDTANIIDGNLYQGDVVNQSIQLGAVEEWTIINNADEDHNFHIHTNPFVIIDRNGVAKDPPLWGDTVVLPAGGSVTFRSRFLDFTGEYVLHCHIIDHEDLGMMQNVEVVA
jgi:FtsP/CotA-like multicopper oxidase with cupredoxin domain